MKLRCIAGIAGLLLSGTAVPEPVVNDETLVEQVRCVEIAFAESVANGDVDAFARLVHADARFAGSGVMRGRDEILRAWAVFFEHDGPAITWRPEVVEVLEQGTLALSRGPYRVQAADADGNVSEEWGTYNSVWQKQADGAWQIIFDAGSPAAEPPPPATRALIEDAAPPCAAAP